PIEMGDLLDDFMTPTLQAGMTVSSATGSTITVASASAAVGGFVLLNTGEAAQLLSVSSTTYTVGTSQITAASVSGVAIGSCWYQMKTSDFRCRMFDSYRGRLDRQAIYGCMPSVDIDIS